jgi:hypothetical protein
MQTCDRLTSRTELFLGPFLSLPFLACDSLNVTVLSYPTSRTTWTYSRSMESKGHPSSNALATLFNATLLCRQRELEPNQRLCDLEAIQAPPHAAFRSDSERISVHNHRLLAKQPECGLCRYNHQNPSVQSLLFGPLGDHIRPMYDSPD